MVKHAGFSLIELTVVIGLLSLLVLAISSTMLMSILSSNRIRTITKLKQAGNYAISQMQDMIRNSKSVVDCVSSPTDNYLTIIGQDGGETTYDNESDDNGYTHVASNSGYYLTPDNTDLGSSFSLSCDPPDATPTLIKISFDLQNAGGTGTPAQNPTLHFETSVNLRN